MNVKVILEKLFTHIHKSLITKSFESKVVDYQEP